MIFIVHNVYNLCCRGRRPEIFSPCPPYMESNILETAVGLHKGHICQIMGSYQNPSIANALVKISITLIIISCRALFYDRETFWFLIHKLPLWRIYRMIPLIRGRETYVLTTLSDELCSVNYNPDIQLFVFYIRIIM